MEKNIINPADICTTLRLPTRVNASKPAFSLGQNQKVFQSNLKLKVHNRIRILGQVLTRIQRNQSQFQISQKIKCQFPEIENEKNKMNSVN